MAEPSPPVSSTPSSAMPRQPPSAPPGAEENPREYARLVLSHPPELFDRLEKLLGPSDALQLCEHNNRRPPSDPSPFARRVDRGTRNRRHHTHAARIAWHDRRSSHPARAAAAVGGRRFRAGPAIPPPPPSLMTAISSAPGQRVLDRCCGLGTKRSNSASGVGENGIVIAIDPGCHGELKRCITRHITAILKYSSHSPAGRLSPMRKAKCPADGFDHVLIDIPCSNSGVLGSAAAPPDISNQRQHRIPRQPAMADPLTDTSPRRRPRRTAHLQHVQHLARRKRTNDPTLPDRIAPQIPTAGAKLSPAELSNHRRRTLSRWRICRRAETRFMRIVGSEKPVMNAKPPRPLERREREREREKERRMLHVACCSLLNNMRRSRQATRRLTYSLHTLAPWRSIILSR